MNCRRLLSLLLLVILSWISVSYAQAAPASEVQLTVIDARSAREREDYRLSNNILDCSYGVYNIRDGIPGFDRIAQLQREVSASLGDAALGQELTVRRYVLFWNAAALETSRAVSAGFGGGAIAGAIANGVTARPRCARERMPNGGWFDPTELSNNFGPLIAEISVEYAGHTYEVRSVYSPVQEIDARAPRMFGATFSRPQTVESLNSAMSKANAALAALILAQQGPTETPANSP